MRCLTNGRGVLVPLLGGDSCDVCRADLGDECLGLGFLLREASGNDLTSALQTKELATIPVSGSFQRTEVAAYVGNNALGGELDLIGE